MGTVMEQTPGDATEPIEQLRGGDRRALATLFVRYRDRLRGMVELRIEKSCPCGVSSSFPGPKRPEWWGSTTRLGPDAIFVL